MNTVVKKILKTIKENGYEAYIVGGYVRDFYLQKETNDYDICTNAPLSKISKWFTGKRGSYGSFHMKEENLTIDITVYRKEKEYQNRRPTSITKTNSLKVDLLRRDFTINTLCMDEEGEILDLLNGLEDIKQKKIRMVGDIKTKLIEDPLRILRAIRFATILNFTLEENLEKEIIKNKELLATLSSYRIKEEIERILLSPYYKKGLTFLKEQQMCTYLGISYTNLVYTSSILGMWAQIKIKKNLPFTKEEKENIVKLQEIMKGKIISREVLYQYGLNLSLIAGEILGISSYSIHELYKKMPIHTRKELQISMQEICTILEVSPSRKIKEIENQLIYEVLYERIKNTNSSLKEVVATMKRGVIDE